MIGTTEAFTRQPISQLDCNTVGISRDQGAGGSLHEGTVKLSGILGFWRRNRSSVERRINNLGTCQGAD